MHDCGVRALGAHSPDILLAHCGKRIEYSVGVVHDEAWTSLTLHIGRRLLIAGHGAQWMPEDDQRPYDETHHQQHSNDPDEAFSLLRRLQEFLPPSSTAAPRRARYSGARS